ncbi:MAG: toprim domain-containing protein [Cyclonatronaceae bacterium]
MQISSLLIVESPTIATIIDGFRLPGVEVVATAGYSWKPKPDFSKGTLKGTASPKLLPFRNRIRSAAARASRVILATDTDPSGEFIASCLAGELKNRQIFRGYLNLLSPQGVTSSIEQANPYQPGATHALLNRLYINAKLLPRLPPFISRSARAEPSGIKYSPLSVALGILALYPFFLSQRGFTRFIADQVHYVSDRPVPAVYGSEITTGIVSGDPDFYHVIRPWNTGKFISSYSSYNKSVYQTGHFKRVQNTLNRLFTTIYDETGSGLITYPRTHAAGYYRATWQQEYERLIRFNQAEAILPVTLWSITPDESAHEGLRPLNMGIAPPDIRPLVRKNIFDAYSLLFESTSAAFRQPEKSNTPVYTDNNGHLITIDPFPAGMTRNRNLFSSSDRSQPYSESKLLTAVSSLDDLTEYLSLNALMPASATGSTLDTLISDGWINISGNDVLPGYQMEKLPALINKTDDVLHLLQLLNDKLSLAEHPAELDDLINRMTSLTTSDF